MATGLVPRRRPEPGADWIDAYVVFQDEGFWPGWWRYPSMIMEPGFRHVWIFRWHGERWIAGNAGWSGFDLLDCGEHPLLPELLAARATVVHVQRWRSARWHPRGLLNCVSLSKMALGIRDVTVITPHSLFRYLLGEGQSLVETEDGRFRQA